MIRTLHLDSSSGKGGSVRSLARLLQSNAANPLFEPRVLLGQPGPVLTQFQSYGVPVDLVESLRKAPGCLQRWLVKKSPGTVQAAFFSTANREVFQELDRHFKKNQDLLLHANISPLQDYGALQAARKNGIPTVCHLRAWPPGHLRSSLNPVLPDGCQFISVSEAVRKAWIRKGLPAGSVHVVFNSHEPHDVPAADLNSLLPPHLHSRPVVCCIARFVSWKNHEFLLNSWARHRKRIPDAVLIFLGDGPLESSLKKLSKTLNVQDSVAFLGYRPEVLSILRSCQALVLPSLREPMARVILEAFGARVPVVAVNSGGTPEIVKDGITGFLADESNGEHLIGSLQKVLYDKSLALEITRASRELLHKEFNPVEHHQKISRIFQETLFSASKKL